MSGIDRTQILRIDCTACRGNGYVSRAGMESICERCEGKGVVEKEVPYKFETQGRWTREDLAEAFEISVDEVRDEGHSAGD